jgi:hypothetical protein
MLYKISQIPDCVGFRLSRKNPEKPYLSRYLICNENGEEQDESEFVIVTETLPKGTVGFFIRDSYIKHKNSQTPIPCVLLLMNEKMLHVPAQCVHNISQQEMEDHLDLEKLENEK